MRHDPRGVIEQAQQVGLLAGDNYFGRRVATRRALGHAKQQAAVAPLTRYTTHVKKFATLRKRIEAIVSEATGERCSPREGAELTAGLIGLANRSA